jgi:hypothetical protein
MFYATTEQKLIHTFSHLSFKCDPNAKKDTIQILNQTCCSHVMKQLQIIILSKLYLHVTHGETAEKTRMFSNEFFSVNLEIDSQIF